MREVDEEGFAIRPNKSEQKRQLAVIQDLVVSLIEVPEKTQIELGLSDQIRNELKQARAMKAGSARKRLIKHLTKLCSQQEMAPVLEYFDKESLRQQQSNARFHALERWRDRLIETGDEAIQEFLEQYPNTDRQQLRQLVLGGKRERETGKPAGAGKKLFRLIREIAETT